MRSIIIICGPTASGKSACALDIAHKTNGVIINADAMQLYEGLRILTARPSPEEEAAAPHRLYGTLPAHETCSAARWLHMAQQEIDGAFAAGRLPIVTGGTGLYIKSLMEGLPPLPDIAPKARAEATMLWNAHGSEALKGRDPVMYGKLKAGDSQRHIRALEVMLATGRSLASWQEEPRIRPYPDVGFDVRLIDLPRAELYRRCDARFAHMMQQGALEEAKSLHALHLPEDRPVTKAVGVREMFAHLDGAYSLDEAVAKACQATRNYAKRQLTWFRHQL